MGTDGFVLKGWARVGCLRKPALLSHCWLFPGELGPEVPGVSKDLDFFLVHDLDISQ